MCLKNFLCVIVFGFGFFFCGGTWWTKHLVRSGFWNSSLVEMKFSVEKRWIKCVRKAENNPNYGMAQMDGQLENHKLK